jgi:photosystem II stability/assembly factor-like uncharacterized protein
MIKLDYKKFRLFSLFVLFAVLLTGCISFSGGSKKTTKIGPFGVYKSADESVTWQLKNDILNVEGKKVTLNNVTVRKIIFDPSDNKVLYLTTTAGLFYSFDAGDSWQRDQLFKANAINDVAVNYFDKCLLYVSAGQSIYKTEDCMRTWQEVYFDKSRAGLQVVDLETEDFNSNVVYAATNLGDVLKSVDYGKTWKTIKRLGNNINQIFIDEADTRIVYIVTRTKGIFKTIDGGTTWSSDDKETDLNQELKAFNDAKNGYSLAQDVTRKNTLIYASKYGLLRTNDGGMTWEKINLITPPRSGVIWSLEIDPKDGNKIYYGTENTLYKSVDGGQNWSTQNSPSNSIIDYIKIDPEDSKVIYLGMRQPPQK